MNVQEYISSGVVESYVLGLASNEERREFEELCLQYPEVLEARNAFELSLEKQAMQYAEAPAPALKARIWNEIKDEAKEEAKVIPLPQQQAPVRNINWLKYAAAACVILLAGSIYYNITLSKKNKALTGDYNNSMAELNMLKEDMEMLTNKPQVRMASLKGLEASPQSYTTVYWDSTSHDVYLLVNNLPKPPTDKQYQLWALADGKPIDLGFIGDGYFVKKDRLLIKAKNVLKAQAFAITLEKKNRPDPEKPAGDMYVMGNL